MGSYIVIDGGTTTTRIGLADGERIIDKIKISLGARANMEAPGSLQRAVREGIETLLERHAASPECIIAAGMITSEFGLFALPHISAPAGIEELSEGIKQVYLDEISPLPFYFVPGIKTWGELEKTDMMRGEECEVFGIADGDAVYVLPGSHSKVITVKSGKITDFRTLLTGEMAASLAGGTILKDAVSFDAALDEGYLLRGYDCAQKNGLNEALFKTRILKNLLGADENEVYSFFLGAVLEGEIRTILAGENKRIVVAGKAELRDATVAILKTKGIQAEAASNDAVEQSTFLGMIRIFEHKKSRN